MSWSSNHSFVENNIPKSSGEYSVKKINDLISPFHFYRKYIPCLFRNPNLQAFSSQPVLNSKETNKSMFSHYLENHISFHQFTSGFFVPLASQVSVHVHFIDFWRKPRDCQLDGLNFKQLTLDPNSFISSCCIPSQNPSCGILESFAA